MHTKKYYHNSYPFLLPSNLYNGAKSGDEIVAKQVRRGIEVVEEAQSEEHRGIQHDVSELPAKFRLAIEY